MKFSVLFPELTEGQIKQLERLMLEVIDNTPKSDSISVNKYQERLRERLQELLS